MSCMHRRLRLKVEVGVGRGEDGYKIGSGVYVWQLADEQHDQFVFIGGLRWLRSVLRVTVILLQSPRVALRWTFIDSILVPL